MIQMGETKSSLVAIFSEHFMRENVCYDGIFLRDGSKNIHLVRGKGKSTCSLALLFSATGKKHIPFHLRMATGSYPSSPKLFLFLCVPAPPTWGESRCPPVYLTRRLGRQPDGDYCSGLREIKNILWKGARCSVGVNGLRCFVLFLNKGKTL